MSIEPKRIAMPIADINSDLLTRSFATSKGALVQKAKLNSKAPTCFVALKVRT